ncbi:MAG: Acyltransferase family protein [Methanoregula sp. PtaU1.Bin051]|nr:MAG: Acyltransferase family protein [Methanoregula sp. PtaU1.Bin051]
MAGTVRYIELDAARGVAILMMILFHTLFDLSFFQLYPVNVASGFWRYFAFATASLFLLIAGISLSLSHARALHSIQTRAGIVIKYLKRGAFIFVLGLLVTLATYLYLHEGFVIFGILQVIGVSIMLSPLFFRFNEKNILIGAVLIVIGMVFSFASIDGPLWLVPVGIHPADFWSVDYEPVFPWSGLVLIGMGLGSYIYKNEKRAFTLPDNVMRFFIPLSFLGRHSLLIYLVHQPAILLIMQVLTGARVYW